MENAVAVPVGRSNFHGHVVVVESHVESHDESHVESHDECHDERHVVDGANCLQRLRHYQKIPQRWRQ